MISIIYNKSESTNIFHDFQILLSMVRFNIYNPQELPRESHSKIYPTIDIPDSPPPPLHQTSEHVSVDHIHEHDGTNIHFRKLRKTGSHLENKSPTILNGRPISFNRTSSYAPSIGGQSHFSTDHDHLIPPPSTAKEKSKMTRRYFATVFAISYAIFLVVFGAVLFISDAVVSHHPVPQVNFLLTFLNLYILIIYMF